MLTESTLAQLEELAKKRAGRQEHKRRQLAEDFVEMGKRREADLARLKGDEALAESIRDLSSRTIRRMYLAQHDLKTLIER
ncbi:hypothetical protein [Sulfitobacter sp. R18_1]|uniref:hypothetical protein n=1 Tax=Sulfitobacter sp. R18_1 TaxID=2821104 RepID=UPI001ADCED23|nr:hypothetical protein [Sulfitobacter sp. R18_1]MBO9428148.1 hypothetical protein [Sulfitobacter sp. R18_1]